MPLIILGLVMIAGMGLFGFMIYSLMGVIAWYLGIGVVWFLLCMVFRAEAKQEWFNGDGFLYLLVLVFLWPVDILMLLGEVCSKVGKK